VPPLSTTRGFVRRLNDPDHPVPAVVLMSLGSLVLFGAVLVALPQPAQGIDEPIVDAAPLATTSSLLEGTTSLVLPIPSGDRHQATTIVNHRLSGVEVGARMVNGDGLEVELAEAGPRATEVRVSSGAVHRCGAYAGSLVLEATHAEQGTDLLVMDVRFAECSDEFSSVAMAPPSVNDTEPTWADEGRAPWKPAPTTTYTAPAPTEPEPEPTTDTARDDQAGGGKDDGTDKPDKPKPSPEPTSDPTTAEPTAEPEPEPEPTATAEPEPEPEPTATAEPEPEPEPTQTSTTTTSAPSPSPAPTSDGGSDAATESDG
jgi:hypothetical protein